MGYKNITQNEAKRIWYLHKKGLNPNDIAIAVERNRISVNRVVDVFTKTINEEWDALEREYAKSHKNLLNIAKAYFNIEQQEEPKATKEPTQDNTAKYLCNVLAELRRNNELLEKLVAAWEVG